MSRKFFWRTTLPFFIILLASLLFLGIYAVKSGPGSQIVIIIAITIALSLLLTLLAGIIIARRQTRMVEELSTTCLEITRGKIGERLNLRYGNDASKLVLSFNEMSFYFKNRIDALGEEFTRLSIVLDNMTDGVIMTNTEGNIVLANKAAEDLFRISEENIRNKPLIEAVRNHQIDSLMKRCLETAGQQAAQFEYGNSGKFLQTIAIPVTKGKIIGILLLFQNLTELRSLQTMRKDLIGNISHEFRTPLSGIKAMVETLQDGALADSRITDDFLNRINGEVDRMVQMVAELNELSRIETGSTELVLEEINFNALVRETVAQLTPQASRKNLTITTSLKESLPFVTADRERILQVIINLLHNAVKFTPPDGAINVTTKLENNSVITSVSDNGIGISHDDLPHVFERFFKADRARTGSSSGLGLAIAKHVITAHHGKIWVVSEEDKGANFSFSLPITQILPGMQYE